MGSTMTKSILFIPLLFAFCVLAGCGTDRPHVRDDDAQAAFAEVLDLYNDRLSIADEATALARPYLPTGSSVLSDLANARSSVAALHATPAFVDAPALFERFDVAQRQLTDAISQLMVVCESVHRLSATPRFHQLQVRLETSARRIAEARDRYDSAAQRYNASLRSFPLSLAQAVHADADKPTFPARDGSPVHRRPRSDFGALRGSLRV
ncbi:LemA family protein [Burkholderia sp. Ac-20365]|uniref:LemA family protein n=1 Tax=Burkholderia sp. Ac-20365 TaxID=2703897 RepID=UPI001F11F27C|nr:LemA family protein [Burkholderia sp. Ac-20365]